MFLDDAQLKRLTGYSQKAKQVKQLKQLGIPHYVNAAGCPVVPVVAVEGNRATPARKPWSPSVGR